MSSWSHTSEATHWPLTGRSDWNGVRTWGAPVVFPCDYKAGSERKTDAKGAEFIARQTIYTERASIKPGDMVLIGVHAGADPIAAGALEVRAVDRSADTFDQAADDYEVTC